MTKVKETEVSFLSEYLNKYFKEDVNKIIECANMAKAQSFMFNQRWDMERTYKSEVFEGEIDFLHQPGNDREWIFAFNRLRHLISLAEAYVLTGDDSYAETASSQMKLWIDKVKKDDEKCKDAWRTIEAGIRLDSFVKTYLLIKDSASFKKIEKDFFSSIEDHASFILQNSWGSYYLMSNWGVLSNHGLYVASCVFNKKEWREEALRRLSLELKNEVYDDGVQWEQSPMYHNEVLRDYLDVIMFSRLYGYSLEPWFEEKVHKMALVNLKWVKPNGTEPMMGDSDDIDMKDLMTYSAFIFKDSELKALSYHHLDSETTFLVGEEGIKEYEEIEVSLPKETDFFLSDSGNVIARSGWGEKDSYLRFHCGTLGAGHGHADQTHISFVYNGEDFLVDAGRYTYVFGGGREEFKDNRSHNVVIVDNTEIYKEKDSWECFDLDRAVNVRASFKGSDVAIEGGHLGYIEKGVFSNRKILWMKEKELLFVFDEFYGSGNHSYEQIFHFSETLNPIVEGNKIRVGDCLITQISSSELSLRVEDSSISRHYNQRIDNKALITKINAVGFASIITVFDFRKDKMKEKKVEVRSNFKGIVFPDSTIEGVELTSEKDNFVIVCAHKEYATPTDTFLSSGCTGFGSLTIFNKGEGEIEIGKRMFS